MSFSMVIFTNLPLYRLGFVNFPVDFHEMHRHLPFFRELASHTPKQTLQNTHTPHIYAIKNPVTK